MTRLVTTGDLGLASAQLKRLLPPPRMHTASSGERTADWRWRMSLSGSSYDGGRDLSDLDRFLQRACGALGRLRAEQMMRGLPPTSQPAQAQPAEAETSAHDAAVAESLALMDDELRAAIDAALVAQYPRLQRLRERVGADAYDDDDEWASLDHRERARMRFTVWLRRRGQMSEWRTSDASGDTIHDAG